MYALPYELIESIRRVKTSEVRVEGALSAFPAGRPTHCLELRAPVTAVGLYGIRKTTGRIAMQVDERERFEQALGAQIPR